LAAVPLILLLVLSTISFAAATSKVVFEMDDPVGDDYGPGTYTYPTAADFHTGMASNDNTSFDLTHFKVSADENYVVFEFTYDNLGGNVWTAAYGFSLQYPEVYIDKDRVSGSGKTSTYGANLQVASADAWEVALTIGPDPSWNPPAPNAVYIAEDNGDVTTYGGNMVISVDNNTVIAKVPIALTGEPTDGWAYTVITGGWDTGHMRGIQIGAPSDWIGGGADENALIVGVVPLAYDILVPKGMDQSTVLKSYDINAATATAGYATVHAVSPATEAPASAFPLSTLAVIIVVIVVIIAVVAVVAKRR